MTDAMSPANMDRFSQLRGVGHSAKGLVTAEVDGTGDIVELAIDRRAMELGESALSAAVVEAFRAARELALSKMADELAETPSTWLGNGVPGVDALRFDAQHRLDEMTALAEGLIERLGKLG